MWTRDSLHGTGVREAVHCRLRNLEMRGNKTIWAKVYSLLCRATLFLNLKLKINENTKRKVVKVRNKPKNSLLVSIFVFFSNEARVLFLNYIGCASMGTRKFSAHPIRALIAYSYKNQFSNRNPKNRMASSKVPNKLSGELFGKIHSTFITMGPMHFSWFSVMPVFANGSPPLSTYD